MIGASSVTTSSLDLISSQLNPTPSKKGSEKPDSSDIKKWSYKSACIRCDINVQSQIKDMVLWDQLGGWAEGLIQQTQQNDSLRWTPMAMRAWGEWPVHTRGTEVILEVKLRFHVHCVSSPCESVYGIQGDSESGRKGVSQPRLYVLCFHLYNIPIGIFLHIFLIKQLKSQS